MALPKDIANIGSIANAMYNSITANATAITSISVSSANSANLTTTTNVATIGTAAYFVANGNVGIGNSTPNAKLAVTGTANISGNVVFGSGISVNGSFGTAGQALISNGAGAYWANSAAQGSWVYLSTVTATNAATADIETTFDSTYNTYAIVASPVSAVSGSSINIRFKVSGSYSSSALYNWASIAIFADSVTVIGAFDNIDDRIQLVTEGTIQAGRSHNFICYVYNASSTSEYKTVNIVGQSWKSDQVGNFSTSGTYKDTPAVTGVRFSPVNGNINGTFRLYGIKNS